MAGSKVTLWATARAARLPGTAEGVSDAILRADVTACLIPENPPTIPAAISPAWCLASAVNLAKSGWSSALRLLVDELATFGPLGANPRLHLGLFGLV